MALKRCLVALFLGVSLGCFGNESTEFPPGLEPLEEEHQAPPPDSSDTEPYLEELSMVDGEIDDYHWVHAATYVHAPIESVYQAIRTPDVNINRRAVDAWDVREADIEPDYEYSHRLYARVDEIITVEYEVEWRFGSMRDEGSDLAGVRARWQKVWGSEVIGLLRGSVSLEPINEDTTLLRVIEHLDALQGRGENARNFVADFVSEVHLYSRGEPLPTYN